MKKDTIGPVEDPKIAVLASGGGSTGTALADAIEHGEIKGARIVLVVVNSVKAGIVRKAEARGIPCVICSPKYKTPEQFGRELLWHVHGAGANVVLQLGWLPRTPKWFIENFNGVILNQHPGPLDPENYHRDFGGPGMHGKCVHCSVLWFARQRDNLEHMFTEASVHVVTPEFDQGAVVGRKRVAISPDDDPYTLADRVLPFEHELVIKTVRSLATEGLVPLERETPLIPDNQISLLRSAKRVAVILFPHG